MDIGSCLPQNNGVVLNTKTNSLVCSLEEIDHAEDVSIATHRLTEFRREGAYDTVMQSLIVSVKSG